MKKVIKRFLRLIIKGIQYIYGLVSKDNHTTLYFPPIKDPKGVADLNARFTFYTNDNYKVLKSVSFARTLAANNNPLLLLGDVTLRNRILTKFRENIFRVDQLHNPVDGWEWAKFSTHISSLTPDTETAQSKFISYVNKIRSNNYSRAYLFGTGPSLAKAIDRSWKDGYRIVCNTIVRDRELWKHIDPHFIVAGDAIYHFGFTEFAKAFRVDLRKRLLESETKFMYPLLFHELVMREMHDVADKLIPIPYGLHTIIHNDLTKVFSMPKAGNVLNILMLPLGCTMSKNVCLWGFDGRASNDKGFWANSSKHTYPEHMEALRTAHPAFFSNFVPQSNPDKYVKDVHGEGLENSLREAEIDGWHFSMLHDSYTPCLQKRRDILSH